MEKQHEIVKVVPKSEPTPSSDILLEEIIVPQMVKIFQVLYGIGGFISLVSARRNSALAR
jgi:hypothetical protein